MARIAGVDLPKNKRGEIGLTYIYGIGRSSARKILTDCGIDFDTKVSDWNDDQIAASQPLGPLSQNTTRLRVNSVHPYR